VALVYLDGELLPEEQATVSVFDRGLVTGDGVFETLLVRQGRPFAVRRHLDRLERSAAGLGIDLPARASLETAIADVAASIAGAERARLRVTLTSGPGPLGSARTESKLTVAIAAAAIPPDSTAPATVALSPWPRNEHGALAGLKTTSYAENVKVIEWAREQGASEAVFGNTAGNLCEGTGSNVFVVIGGVLLTPPLSAGALAGVTRELVLELVDCVEQDLPFESLLTEKVEEIFLTSTTRAVQAVDAVVGRASALPAGGPRAAEAAGALAALMASTDEP
jgi:branched-chain amino acid aminotransferase